MAWVVVGGAWVLGCGSPPAPEPTPTPFPPWQFPEPAAKPSAAPTPAVAADFADTGTRCVERIRERLVVQRDGKRITDLSTQQALELDGAITVSGGRHKDEPGLPLTALLGDASAIELVPCRGEPRAWTAAALEPDPARWVLVLSGKQTLKLLDMHEDSTSARLKNLALVRLE